MKQFLEKFPEKCEITQDQTKIEVSVCPDVDGREGDGEGGVGVWGGELTHWKVSAQLHSWRHFQDFKASQPQMLSTEDAKKGSSCVIKSDAWTQMKRIKL